VTDQWFSPGTRFSSTNKIDRHDITEKLLNTINPNLYVTLYFKSLYSIDKTKNIFSGRKKIHFTFTDGTEMSEEYDVRTEALVGMYYLKI
jgi:hypothetical protein